MNRVHASQTSSTEDQQLVELVEEITARLQAGESCDVDEYAARFPEYADRLRDWMTVMSAMADLGHSLAVGAASRAAHIETHIPYSESGDDHPTSSIEHPASSTGVLGDFRILRELGRGGMGVVYEAEQISIGRRVALKVLPFAAMLDKQQLNRFKNEARAAGTLDHPNIVAIYSVGTERGVHYYAMQLIEGQSLAQVVEQLRKKSGSGVVQQRSRGVEDQTNNYSTTPLLHSESSELSSLNSQPSTLDTQPIAHLSTLHAPSSSLPAFSSREYFRTIAQLGIQAAEALDHAHQNGILHRDVKPANLLVDDTGKLWITDFGLARMELDSGMTMTGDLLGTLRYMSPEQAAGKRLPLDHRTEVYSLGITLYELLAGRPAFDSSDRRELLRAIAEVDPPPLRKLTPTVLADLETIIHKAMEKDAVDRYASAGEMAADLRRFLEDRPIFARTPSIISRARKWIRRHSTAAAVTVGALLFGVIGLSIGTVVLNSANRRATLEKNEAESNLRLAAEAVDQLLAEMGREAGVYGQLPQAERILQQAARFYQQLIAKSNDSAILLRAATAHNHIGWLYRTELGRQELAIQKHQAALALLDRVDTGQNPTEKLITRAIAYDGIGEAYMGINNLSAESHLNQARAIWQQLVDSNPRNVQYLDELVGTLNSQAVLYLDSGRLDDAEFTYRLILDLSTRLPPQRSQTPDQLNTTAGVTCNLGTVAVERGRLAEAEPLFREAITIQEKVVALKPRVSADEHDLYKFQWNLVDLFVRQGKHAAASTAVEKLIERFPNRLQAYYEAADLLLRCAEIAETAKHTSAEFATTNTVQRYREGARRLIAGAHEAKEQTPDWLEHFAWFLVMCKDKSFRDPARALALADAGLAESLQRDLLHQLRGIALYRLGQYQAAVHALEQSAAPRGRANIVDMLFLAMSHWQLGNQKEAREWYAAAVDWIAKHQPQRRSVYTNFAAAHGEILTEAQQVLATNLTTTTEQP